MEVTLQDVANQVTAIARQLEKLDGRLEKIDGRLDGSDARLNRLEGMEARLKHQAQVYRDELKEEVRNAAEAYGGVLAGINRELVELNKKVDTRFGDHDLIFANHNERIAYLEKPR